MKAGLAMKKFEEFSHSVISLSLFLVFSSVNANAQLLASERQPIPSQENQLTVQEEIKDFYKTEFREARSVNDKKQLAQQLMTDAMAVDEDSAARYALLRMAQDLSNETKDLELGLEIADSIASSFTISQCRARAEAIVLLAKAKGKIEKGQRLALAHESLKQVDSLLDERNFDLAQQMVNIAADSARKAREFVLFRHTRAFSKDLDSMVAEQKEIEMAEGDDEKVKKTERGKFEAYVVDDWYKGLALLSEGSDVDLKSLAEQTLLALEDTGFPVQLADQWWKIGETYSGRRERVVKRFAADMYRDALASLDGIQEKRTKSRIASTENLLAGWISIHKDDEPVGNLAVDEPPPKKRRARMRKGAKGDQEYTTFGQIKLNQQEIQIFINQCKVEKPKKLRELQSALNARVSRMTPAEILNAREMFEFVSRENVLIVPREFNGKVGAIFKYYATDKRFPYAAAETIQIIDKRSAYITFRSSRMSLVIGIDTSRLPAGRWNSYLLLKRVADRQVPGIVGQTSVPVYQAVSNEGFPKDILLW